MEIEKGALYVVATPIGNMADITERAAYTLANVDFIAAEDTRVTGLLLARLGLKKKLVSCREHNIISKSEQIIERLKLGESCAAVTDAGTPCISDPGEVLVKRCVSAGIKVFTVPGACAAIAALAISGLDTERFCFEGFLSVAKKQRSERLEILKNTPFTIIFYESPHRLVRTLSDLLEHFGDRKIAVCRELTKMYEEVIRGRISEIIEIYKEKSPKGEYVLVVDSEAAEIADNNQDNLEKAAQSAAELQNSGLSLSQAAKIVSEQTGLKKSEIYKKAITIN